MSLAVATETKIKRIMRLTQDSQNDFFQNPDDSKNFIHVQEMTLMFFVSRFRLHEHFLLC